MLRDARLQPLDYREDRATTISKRFQVILNLAIHYFSKLNRATQVLLQTLIANLRFQRKNQKSNKILHLGALANNILFRRFDKMKIILVYSQVPFHWVISKTPIKQISRQFKHLVSLHPVKSQVQTWFLQLPTILHLISPSTSKRIAMLTKAINIRLLWVILSTIRSIRNHKIEQMIRNYMTPNQWPLPLRTIYSTVIWNPKVKEWRVGQKVSQNQLLISCSVT